MNTAEISALLGTLGAVVSLAEKYGPEVYTTVINAFGQTKRGTGLTSIPSTCLLTMRSGG
ncbi:hypothetical protein [Acetobacter sp.]|uniref:hypothetical protein n=1 Tax=Acetobacter sp. TaxID=440 RepID=UPI0025C6DC66|nr:hypothetical protein [Acetobacter sp.]MCH4092049.1 hypothetical protein [Acetobacter sp.]MCI1300696.1 hypothetical protein [Acetobacter sp.]MCI1317631.1 hypothetical protein [Acetobacter sp.]